MSPQWGPAPAPPPLFRRLSLGRFGTLLRRVLGVWRALALLVVTAVVEETAGVVGTVSGVLNWLVAGYLVYRLVRWIRRRLAHYRFRRAIRDDGIAGNPHLLPQQLARAEDPLDAVRMEACARGGGAYLGFLTTHLPFDTAPHSCEWVSADPEHAVLVLGPPRSGKTSGIIIPAIVAHPGAAISTSTKGDVFAATRDARANRGVLWWFDPSGDTPAPEGCRPLSWSPVTAAATWDGALLMATAMASASPQAHGNGDSHWTERAGTLLAPLLHAAALGGLGITDVHQWVLRQDLNACGLLLEEHLATIANDVLVGIAQTADKERSGIFSTASAVLAAYNAEGPRRVAAHPNFDAAGFVRTADTIYIVAPAHKQRLTAPLVVGLLEDIRHATYQRAAAIAAAHEARQYPILFALDEAANIAPIHDLPAMVSEGGGQGAHIMACFQDLSQVRGRWGTDVADGFLSLFQTKVILPGIGDTKTLESLSIAIGEYDRVLQSQTSGFSYDHRSFFPSRSTSRTNSIQRTRILEPGQIANTPDGYFLMMRGVKWWKVQATPYYSHNPWPKVLETARARAQRNPQLSPATPETQGTPPNQALIEPSARARTENE